MATGKRRVKSGRARALDCLSGRREKDQGWKNEGKGLNQKSGVL